MYWERETQKYIYIYIYIHICRKRERERAIIPIYVYIAEGGPAGLLAAADGLQKHAIPHLPWPRQATSIPLGPVRLPVVLLRMTSNPEAYLIDQSECSYAQWSCHSALRGHVYDSRCKIYSKHSTSAWKTFVCIQNVRKAC